MRTKVTLITVLRNAIAVVATPLLPGAVLGLPAARAMLLPDGLLFASRYAPPLLGSLLLMRLLDVRWLRLTVWWLSVRLLLNVRWLLGLALLFGLSLVLLLRGLALWLMLLLPGIHRRDCSGKQRQDPGEDKLGCSFHVHLRY